MENETCKCKTEVLRTVPGITCYNDIDITRFDDFPGKGDGLGLVKVFQRVDWMLVVFSNAVPKHGVCALVIYTSFWEVAPRCSIN